MFDGFRELLYLGVNFSGIAVLLGFDFDSWLSVLGFVRFVIFELTFWVVLAF